MQTEDIQRLNKKIKLNEPTETTNRVTILDTIVCKFRMLSIKCMLKLISVLNRR